MTVPRSAIALIMVAIGCASTHSAAPPSPFADYRRFFLTMPSHNAGFGMMTQIASTPSTAHEAGSIVSVTTVIDRAMVALEGELTHAGFDVVGRDQDADAVLEITMGGIRAEGEADRAFIAFRDAESGRLLATFGAQARAAPATVEILMARIAGLIEETVEAPAGRTASR